MATLKEKLAERIPQRRDEIRSLVKEHGDKVISEVTVAQAYGGMRGVKGMVCDTSLVDPEKGLIIRGIPVEDLADRIPEEIWYLLMTSELPDDEALKAVQKDLGEHAGVPDYVWDVLRAMPDDSHPMVMLSVGMMSMQKESIFAQSYAEGMKKTEFWEPAYEDSLQLVAKAITVAAGMYRIRFGKGDPIAPDPNLDYGANFVRMLGIDDPSGEFASLMRLYLVLHCDHEAGNVSANTCHTVGSALSDLYYAVTAGWNGLAGPLHGLANQECLKFVLSIKEKFGGVPSDEDLVKFTWDTLNSGQVIPGYGHAVLRETDPRFKSFHKFGQRVCPNDDVFKIVDRLYHLVPDVLKEHGKAKNPYPNVDAGSGALLYHFGLTEFAYYTVLFAVSRALGMTAYYTINRGLGTPITRPKSVTTDWIKKQVGEA